MENWRKRSRFPDGSHEFFSWTQICCSYLKLLQNFYYMCLSNADLHKEDILLSASFQRAGFGLALSVLKVLTYTFDNSSNWWYYYFNSCFYMPLFRKTHLGDWTCWILYILLNYVASVAGLLDMKDSHLEIQVFFLMLISNWALMNKNII